MKLKGATQVTAPLRQLAVAQRREFVRQSQTLKRNICAVIPPSRADPLFVAVTLE